MYYRDRETNLQYAMQYIEAQKKASAERMKQVKEKMKLKKSQKKD